MTYPPVDVVFRDAGRRIDGWTASYRCTGRTITCYRRIMFERLEHRGTGGVTYGSRTSNGTGADNDVSRAVGFWDEADRRGKRDAPATRDAQKKARASRAGFSS